jgi:hypothetical protein
VIPVNKPEEAVTESSEDEEDSSQEYEIIEEIIEIDDDEELPEEPKVEARNFPEQTTESINEYLPPAIEERVENDVEKPSEWEAWKVKKFKLKKNKSHKKLLLFRHNTKSDTQRLKKTNAAD